MENLKRNQNVTIDFTICTVGNETLQSLLHRDNFTNAFLEHFLNTQANLMIDHFTILNNHILCHHDNNDNHNRYIEYLCIPELMSTILNRHQDSWDDNLHTGWGRVCQTHTKLIQKVISRGRLTPFGQPYGFVLVV